MFNSCMTIFLHSGLILSSTAIGDLKMNAGNSIHPKVFTWNTGLGTANKNTDAKKAPEKEGLGTTVAVLSDGVDLSHPALHDKILNLGEEAPTPSGSNGTHIAGVIAGTPNYSNYGKETVDIMPMRGLVDSPDLNRSFPTMEGSGFSAPFVTGMAALLLQKDPDMTPQELFAELWAQSNELGYLSTDK